MVEPRHRQDCTFRKPVAQSRAPCSAAGIVRHARTPAVAEAARLGGVRLDASTVVQHTSVRRVGRKRMSVRVREPRASKTLRGAAAHIQSTTPSSLGNASTCTVHSNTRRRAEETGSEATAAATRYGNTEPSSRLARSSVGPTRLPNAVTASKSTRDDAYTLAPLQLLHCAPASPHVRRAACRHSAQLPPWLSRSRSVEQVKPSLQRSRGRRGRPSRTAS